MLQARHTLAQLSLLALLTIAPACGDSEWPPSSPDAGTARLELDGRMFLLQSAQGFTKLAGSTIRISFQDGAVHFHAGCNSHFAEYELRGDTLLVEGFGSTLIGCGQEQEAQDQWLANFLSTRPKLTLSGDQLTIVGPSASLVLLDREVADPDRPLAGPLWEIDSFIAGNGTTSYLLPSVPTVRFESDGVVHVQSTCNAAEGTYSVAGDRITLTGLGFTERGCPDDNALRAELSIQEVLREGTITFEIEAARLTLMRDSKGLSATTR